MRMRIRFGTLVWVAVFVSLLSASLMAQDKAKKADGKKTQAQNVQGTVQDIAKNTSTITVRTSGAVTRTVVYNPNTKFMYGHSDKNKPGDVAQIKASYYISCAGGVDSKNQLMAQLCVYRESK